jgi:hypothetical protein
LATRKRFIAINIQNPFNDRNRHAAGNGSPRVAAIFCNAVWSGRGDIIFSWPLYSASLGQQQVTTIPDRDLRRFGKTLQ